MSSSASAVPRKPPGTFIAIASTAFAGLAAGALWCLLSLFLERGANLLIVPLAFGVGAYLRWFGLRGARGATCAIVAVLIAFVYAQYLFAAVRVAQTLGFSLRDTLFKMDWQLAWESARATFGALDLFALVLALVVGGWVASRVR